MNKQELIETLEEIKANIDRNSETSDYTDFSRGRKDAYNNTIGLVKQLDEPKKVVVPKFVAEWIELYKKENKTTLWHVMNKIINEKFLNHQNIVIWFENDSNKHILEQAWVNGYEVEKELTIHELKILPEYFEAVVSGNKRFEIRKNDRNYKKGDILRLNEYQDGQYTGDVHVAEITYITDYAQQEGYVVLGIK